jgi:hypothetical protein
MKNALKILSIAAIFLLLPHMALAEEGEQSGQEDSTIEAFAKYQYTEFGGESLLKITGAGFTAGVRIFDNSDSRIGIGLQFSRFSHQRQFSQGNRSQYAPDATSLDGMGWTLAGDVFHRLTSEAFQPYFFYGLGCIYKIHAYHFQSDPDLRKRVVTPAMDIGAGIRFPVSSRLYIVPEVRLLFFPFKRAMDAETSPWKKTTNGDVGIGVTYVISKE